MATSLPILTSVVHGEQIRLHFSLSWINDLASYTITARIVEGDNTGTGTVPTQEDLTSKTIVSLPAINKVANEFDVVLLSTMINSWDVKPTPDKPVYGYFDVEVADNGAGNEQQIFKPVQGLIKITYSPLESS